MGFVGPENYINDNNVAVELKMSFSDKVVKLQLFKEVAPITVDNFVKLVKEGFYDGLIFHRIIRGFMVQGGDPDGTGMGGSSEQIKGEFKNNGVDNPLSHNKGVISMARSAMKDSASSQFFIMHKDVSQLDGDYAAFGAVVEGFEVIEQLACVDTNPGNDRPRVDQKIEYIKIA